MNILETFDSWLWGRFLVILLVGLGIYFTIRLRGMQFRYLPYALKLAFSRHDDQAEGDISQFQALMTALAATIGIGSIAGVATAVVGGGFGAIFWMWIIALVGMVTKFAEAILAVKYREVDHRGQMCGGPMYYIKRGLNWGPLAAAFAIFGALSAFAGGNLTQSNSIADALHHMTAIPPYWTGIVLTLITGAVLLGGIKSIGRVSALLVPTMALFYILGGLVIIFMHYERVPEVLALILKSAFTGQGATKGFLGAGFLAALQYGVARGISSNEAGLGSAPIAAAAAKTDVPGRQALISMTTVFLSTIIVCTITALTIGVTGVFGEFSAQGKLLNGAPLVIQAFENTIPWGGTIVTIGLILFGYSTIIGWSYYGEKCIEYLAGERVIFLYRILFCLIVFLGTLLSLDVVWPIVDIANGFMALPNLIGLFALTSILVRESNLFFALLKKEKKIHKSVQRGLKDASQKKLRSMDPEEYL